ncbi:hypothetical protein ACFCYC_15285 [Streptomyces sp. NPDC056402]|uniref:hypothetical protein n=1 Tax=Streptomyces sp. NPDC056402 TaxID=3345810 RepID=UPI0035E3375E
MLNQGEAQRGRQVSERQRGGDHGLQQIGGGDDRPRGQPVGRRAQQDSPDQLREVRDTEGQRGEDGGATGIEDQGGQCDGAEGVRPDGQRVCGEQDTEPRLGKYLTIAASHRLDHICHMPRVPNGHAQAKSYVLERNIRRPGRAFTGC